jgi:hypothetical protein
MENPKKPLSVMPQVGKLHASKLKRYYRICFKEVKGVTRK